MVAGEGPEPLESAEAGGEPDRSSGADREASLPLGLEPKRLGPGQLVADLVYAPATTPLLWAARAQGAGTCTGLGMLIHQAARQVSLWTGRAPSVEAMSAAALRELGRRGEHGHLDQFRLLGEAGPLL